MDKKLSEMAKAEAEKKEKQNKLIEISQKIYSLKRKTNENDVQATIKEKELNVLKEECNNMKIEAELQKLQIEELKSKVETQVQLLQDETCVLEQIQQDVWKDMEKFINTAKDHVKAKKGVDEAQEYVKMHTVLKEAQDLKKANLELEGEVYALGLYKEFQEKQLMQIQHLLTFLKNAKIHPHSTNDDCSN